MAVGAIDGFHIQIKPPAEDASCFIRKLFTSIQLQAICDHCGKVIDVCSGFPGSVHHAHVLKNSPVYVQQLYPPEGRCILGGGGCYPCLTTTIRLMMPYCVLVLNAVQARYNNKLSRARCIIERSFGMMKTCWRSIFFKSLEVSRLLSSPAAPSFKTST